MLLWQKLAAAALAILLSLLLGFGAGWKVEAWHVKAETADQYKAAMAQTQKDMADSAKQVQAASDKLQGQNADTEANMLKLFQKLGDQDHAFTAINAKLAKLNAGSCQFTSAADGVLQSAYQAAFGSGQGSAPDAGKAAGSDATHPAPRPADGHQ